MCLPQLSFVQCLIMNTLSCAEGCGKMLCCFLSVGKCSRAAGGKPSVLGGGCTGREVCDVAEQAASL